MNTSLAVTVDRHPADSQQDLETVDDFLNGRPQLDGLGPEGLLPIWIRERSKMS